MGAQWWSCVLGLLCIPAEVVLGTMTVSQAPSSIFLTRVNSSAEITCTTSMPGAKGFSLHSNFKGNKQIVYLNLLEGKITKETIAAEFSSRIRVVPTSRISKGQGFTLQLSLLGLEDTDVYICDWRYPPKNAPTPPIQYGNGTMIIIRETAPDKKCKSNTLDLVLITLSVAAFILISLFCTGALIVRCSRQFSGHFRPARDEMASRTPRPQHPSPQHAEHCSYLITSGNLLYDRGLM